MEKKGDMLKQMAIVSDLLEKINIESLFTTVVFDLDEKEFNEVYEKITKKADVRSSDLDKVFSVKIGTIKFLFNKNTV